MLQFMWRSPWSLSKERLGDDKPRFDWPGLLEIDIVLECFMMVPNELIYFELGSEISNDWIFSLHVSTFCKITEWYITLTSSAKEKVLSRRLKTKKEKDATFMDLWKSIKWLGTFILPLGKAFISQMFICMSCWLFRTMCTMYTHFLLRVLGYNHRSVFLYVLDSYLGGSHLCMFASSLP